MYSSRFPHCIGITERYNKYIISILIQTYYSVFAKQSPQPMFPNQECPNFKVKQENHSKAAQVMLFLNKQ